MKLRMRRNLRAEVEDEGTFGQALADTGAANRSPPRKGDAAEGRSLAPTTDKFSPVRVGCAGAVPGSPLEHNRCPPQATRGRPLLSSS